MQIRTLLVDDEYLALNVLEQYASRVPALIISGKVKTGELALEFLRENKIDLLFLDIRMPGINGGELIRALDNPPVTIFTTAYKDFAVDAFEMGAVDYLLKPFSFERFLKAVNKATDVLTRTSKHENISNNDNSSFLVIRANGKTVRVPLSEILYIEGLREYVRVITDTGAYVTLETFKKLESVLPGESFVRVHKSYMVAINRVGAMKGKMLEIGKTKIPISREKRELIGRIIFPSGASFKASDENL